MGALQEDGAKQLLRVIQTAYQRGRSLTYSSAAIALGREANHARAVAQMCDLLDAAAAYSRTPLLALVAVRTGSGDINPSAWSEHPKLKERIVAASLAKTFTTSDFDAIATGLDALHGLGNHAAWKKVYRDIPKREVWRILSAEHEHLEFSRSDPDYEALEGNKRLAVHLRRERKPWLAKKKKDACRERNGGLKCEACGSNSVDCYAKLGIELWEVHHRQPLGQASAVVRNTLADLAILCPSCHRAIHRTRPMKSINQFKAQYFSERT